MSTTVSRQLSDREQLVLRALLWSVVIHLLFFATWKWGNAHAWWSASTPRWMQALTKKLLTPIAIKLPPPPKPQQPTPLIFVDTDPALAMKDPPPKTKYYSANNTAAANVEVKKISEDPNITGHQEHVPKATDAANAKAKPLQPTPTPPKPTEETKEQPEKKPAPAQKTAIGDLAMAKPNDGKAQTNAEPVEAAPEHHRPRLLSDVQRNQGITGQRMHQEGGVANIGPHVSLSAVGKPYGDYDRELIDAIQNCWYQLLDARPPTVSGKVVVKFTLLPSGRVIDVKSTESTVDEFYTTICTSAILNPAPYRPWPRQMELDLGTDRREVQFTFYYDNN